MDHYIARYIRTAPSERRKRRHRDCYTLYNTPPHLYDQYSVTVGEVLLIVCFILLGAPVGLHVLEVRDTSVVLLWEPPAFSGRTPVIGYYVDVKEASAGEEGWKAVHEKANRVKYLKVGTLGSIINFFNVSVQLRCLLWLTRIC